MTVTRLEARRMIDIAGELISNNAFSTVELIKQVRHEIPHATPEDLTRALNARLHDLGEEIYESASEKIDCERCLRIIKRADELTGYSDMTTFEAAVLMAEQGDPESIALLKEFKDLKRGIV
jgi:translation initiation factor 2B subunit (eIF-2B alpha/beta/delta family)